MEFRKSLFIVCATIFSPYSYRWKSYGSIWYYDSVAELVKALVCKTKISRFKSAQNLHKYRLWVLKKYTLGQPYALVSNGVIVVYLMSTRQLRCR